jgi:hypothetical protein
MPFCVNIREIWRSHVGGSGSMSPDPLRPEGEDVTLNFLFRL